MFFSTQNKQQKEPREITLRRNQDTLVIVGTGVIIFGIWSLLKTLFALLLNIGDLYEVILKEETPEGRVAIFIVVTLMLMIDLAFRVSVGLSAIAVARGKKSRFIFVAGALILAFSSATTVTAQIKGIVTGEEITLISHVAAAVELTSLITLTAMQLDFHYYATYCAAFLAGYTHEESLEICYSAQLVDCCSRSFLSRIKGPKSAATTQEKLELVDAKADILSLQEITRIWASFHFLPRDLYAETARWTAKSYRNKYRLICGPNGELVSDTVELAKNDGSLQAVGIAMHILADTWAHQFFAGTCRRSESLCISLRIPGPINSLPAHRPWSSTIPIPSFLN